MKVTTVSQAIEVLDSLNIYTIDGKIDWPHHKAHAVAIFTSYYIDRIVNIDSYITAYCQINDLSNITRDTISYLVKRLI